MVNETTIQNFNTSYEEKGGVPRLRELYEAGASPSDIGEEFGLSSKQVNYYLENIIGENYARYPWRRMMAELGLTPPSERHTQ